MDSLTNLPAITRLIHPHAEPPKAWQRATVRTFSGRMLDPDGGNREWIQYYLEDNNDPIPDGKRCPIRHAEFERIVTT